MGREKRGRVQYVRFQIEASSGLHKETGGGVTCGERG